MSRTSYQHLRHMNAPNMERWLWAAGYTRRTRHRRSKPGTVLKYQIPIRTFAEWNDKRPGFGEIDLVKHDWGTNKGDFAQILNFTGVEASWTEPAATASKAQVHVFATLQTIRGACHFRSWTIDSDNGSKIINVHLWRYCVQVSHLTFSCGRVGRKIAIPLLRKRIGQRFGAVWAMDAMARQAKLGTSTRSIKSIVCISTVSLQ